MSASSLRRSRAINLVGALLTFVVLVVVVLTKVEHGAWIAILAMLLLFIMMKGIRRHYDAIAQELQAADDVRPPMPPRNHAVVLVSRVHLPTLRALAMRVRPGPTRSRRSPSPLTPRKPKRCRRSGAGARSKCRYTC